MTCPKCYLPLEASAWQCDGCGHELRQDFDEVRSSLRSELSASRRVFWLMLFVDVAILCATVFLVTEGWIYVSAPLVLGAIGVTGKAARKIAILREHLSSLDRRHVPVPRAIVHR